MSRAIAAVVAFLVIAPVAAATGAAASVDADRVGATGDTGTAIDEETDLVTLTVQLRTDEGEPVGGAQVEVSYEGGSNTTQSFSNGNALVDVPEGVDATVRVTHSEYIKNQPVTVENVQQDRTVEVTMYQKAVALVQVNGPDGRLEDATVVLRKNGEGPVAAEGKTNEDGVFQSPEIEAGSYDVAAYKRGYRANSTTFELSPEVTTAALSLEEGSVSVEVSVTDDHFTNPQPVSEATVTVFTAGEEILRARTDDSGRRELSIGVNSQYTIRVTKEGYQVDEQTFFLSEDPQSFSFTISREPSFTLQAVNQRIVAGESVLVRVNNAYGDRVQGATIQRNGEPVSETDANGEAQVPIPEEGEFEISAVGEGGSPSSTVIVRGFNPATETTTTTTTETTTTETTTTETTTTTTESDGLPGFTGVVAVVGIVLAVLLARRRSG